jgi:hypothetical protein
MNHFHHLCELIATRIPEAEIAIDEALSPGGAWFADVSRQGQRAVIEWRPGRGFGVSDSSGAYGEGPDVVVTTVGEAFEQVMKLIDATVAAR